MSSYLGNIPSNNFVSLKRQVITGNGGASYTLDYSVASVNDVAIFVNNVRQDPASYSISTTSLTLGGTISSSDSCYVLFLGQALQTVTPDANTITNAMLGETITVANGGTGLTSGFKNGVTEIDSWRVTASFTPSDNSDVTSNWERVDTNFTKVGTGLSESSGIFTFPQTGIYKITTQALFSNNSGNARYLSFFPKYSTDSGSTYPILHRHYANIARNTAETWYMSLEATCFIDVTDASTYRLKFVAESHNGTSTFSGDTSRTETGFICERIGDT